MASTAIAGVAYVTIDGTSYSITGKGTYGPSGSSRETLKGQDGVHGYKEMPQPGFIAWTGRDASALLISALQAAVGVTVVLVLANGKTIVGSNMWRVGDGVIEVDTEEASFDVRFESDDVSEQNNG